MKVSSIATHLRPYSILARRRTTIAHAFASAIASVDAVSPDSHRTAMVALKQDPEGDLFCVYCGHPAETWDHLHSLVKKTEYSGYGHTIRNLVPCCRDCNSRKGGKEWREWLQGEAAPDMNERIALIDGYSASLEAECVTVEELRSLAPDLMGRYERLQNEILRLMHEADDVAAQLRGLPQRV